MDPRWRDVGCHSCLARGRVRGPSNGGGGPRRARAARRERGSLRTHARGPGGGQPGPRGLPRHEPLRRGYGAPIVNGSDRIERHGRAIAGLLVVLGAPQALLGLWALLAPHSFYKDFGLGGKGWGAK